LIDPRLGLSGCVGPIRSVSCGSLAFSGGAPRRALLLRRACRRLLSSLCGKVDRLQGGARSRRLGAIVGVAARIARTCACRVRCASVSF
jgi:hypothetical protein